MSGARDAILGAIRAAHGRGRVDADARRALDTRLEQPTPNLIPAHAQGSQRAQRRLFIDMARAVAATVIEVAGPDEAPAAVADYLAGENLPTVLAAAPDPYVQTIEWRRRPLLELQYGASDGGHALGLTSAFCAVAEAGALMTLSGPGHPTTLNFLPETQIVVMPAARIVGSYEQAWALAREHAAARGGWPEAMPRTVNFIAGPSRTGDIELKIQLGAHGPRRLCVVLVDAPVGAAAEP